MTIDVSRTRMEKAREVQVLSTASITTEGLVLQAVFEGGVQKAKPSAAAAGSEFMGFSWGNRFGAGSTRTQMEVITADANGLLTLSYVALGAGTIGVFPGGYGSGTAALTSNNGAPSGTQFQLLNTGNIQLANSHSGQPFLVVYQFAMTVAQQQAYYGEMFPGQTASAMLGQCGCFTGGILYTDQFDASVDWSTVNLDSSSATELTGGPNGVVTIGGTGCLMSNFAQVKEIPSANSPWLGLYVHN